MFLYRIYVYTSNIEYGYIYTNGKGSNWNQSFMVVAVKSGIKSSLIFVDFKIGRWRRLPSHCNWKFGEWYEAGYVVTSSRVLPWKTSRRICKNHDLCINRPRTILTREYATACETYTILIPIFGLSSTLLVGAILSVLSTSFFSLICLQN